MNGANQQTMRHSAISSSTVEFAPLQTKGFAWIGNASSTIGADTHIMNTSSVGNMFDSLARTSVQRAFAKNTIPADVTPSKNWSNSLASEIMQRFDANGDSLLDATELTTALDAKALPTSADLVSQLMQSILMPSNSSTQAKSDPNSVDAIWQRAQMLSLGQGNGPGDAMLQSLMDRDSDDDRDSSWFW